MSHDSQPTDFASPLAEALECAGRRDFLLRYPVRRSQFI